MAIAERDFIFGPQLKKLARALKTDEERALGRAVLFWENTQHRRFVSGTRDDVEAFFNGRAAKAKADFDAFYQAGLLASDDDGATWRVVGNGKHVSKLLERGVNSHKGGALRGATGKREQNGTFSPAANPCDGPAPSSPASASVPDPKEKDKDLSLTETLSSDLAGAERPRVIAELAATTFEQDPRMPFGHERLEVKFMEAEYRRLAASVRGFEPAAWGSTAIKHAACILRAARANKTDMALLLKEFIEDSRYADERWPIIKLRFDVEMLIARVRSPGLHVHHNGDRHVPSVAETRERLARQARGEFDYGD